MARAATRDDVAQAISQALADGTMLIGIHDLCGFHAYLDGTHGIEYVVVPVDEQNGPDNIGLWEHVSDSLAQEYSERMDVDYDAIQ